MKIDKIDDIILTRELNLDGTNKKIIVEIGRPEKCPEEKDYFCAYRFVGILNNRVSYAIGTDQVQSILLAMKKIAAELYCSPEYKAGLLYWLEEGNRDLGFPLSDGFEIPPITRGSESSLTE